MIQTRIDRIYINQVLEIQGGYTKILPTVPDVSDHAGVFLHTNKQGRKKQYQPSFNRGLLQQDESQASLLVTWKEIMNSNLDTWNAKMVAASKAIREKSNELTKAQKKKWKLAYSAQFEDIIAAEEELQRNWGSAEAREKLSEAQAILHEVRQQKFQFQESAILSKWSRVGDRCTKEFFEFHEGPRKPMVITELMDENRVIDTQKELEEHILTFYNTLYTRDEQVEVNMATRADCLQYVLRKVTEEHNQKLLRPITQEEVTKAVKQLPSGKAPGVYTIPVEFYQILWEDIKLDIFNFTAEAIQQAHTTRKWVYN